MHKRDRDAVLELEYGLPDGRGQVVPATNQRARPFKRSRLKI